MAKYRKKPVIINAWFCSQLLSDAENNWNGLPQQIVAAYERGDILFANHPSRIEIKTLEGTMTAYAGDIVICGVKGELYPIKRDIFAETYELVEPQ